MTRAVVSCRVPIYGDFQAVAYQHLQGLGIRNVEIMVPGAAEIDATRRALEQHGLTAVSMHGECDVASEDCAARVAAQMPAFDALGTKLMFVSCKAGDVPLETAYARLRAAGNECAAHGVTIVMETHPDLITNGDVALRTMRGVDHPNVRVNFDTANVYFYNERIDCVAQLRKIVNYVAAVHLKDTNGGYHTWNFPALGRGIVDFRSVKAVLDEAGFAGPLTLEVEGIEGEVPTERLVCDRVAESIGYLRGVGILRD